MLKSIKKSFKYFAILAGILLVVPTFFSLIIGIPEVQTFITNRIMSSVSEKINSTMSVGRIEFSLFNKLTLYDLLIKDQHNDTLIYSQKITAGIKGFNSRTKMLKLGHAEIDKPAIALITDTTGVMNLNWYLDMLKSTDTSGSKSNSSILVNRISIRDGRFRLLNQAFRDTLKQIDFNHLKLLGINGDVDNINVIGDSVLFKVNDLEFYEAKGFFVRSLNGMISIKPNNYEINDLFLYLEKSIINADKVSVKADSSGSFKRFTDEVKLDIVLHKSLIYSSDLNYFIPSPGRFNESVEITGRIAGTIAELKGRNIVASFGKEGYLNCDFDLSGLPKIQDTYIYVGVKKLKVNAKDFENITLGGNKSLKIPDVLYKLGNISFNGSFTGFLTDFVTYGKIGTDIGNLSTDISLRPEEKNSFRIKGLLKGSNINLGKLTNKPELLGKLSMQTNLDGVAKSIEKISGNITGKVDSIEVKNYVYRNVDINGIFTENTWDGSIKITDRNIKMDMLGMLNFSGKLPEFNFTLNLARSNLYKLNFVKADTTARLSMLLTANFRGNNIDNLDGEIKLLNSTVVKSGQNLELYDFSLKAFNENNKPAISLKTDFLDANLRGHYVFSEIGSSIETVMSKLMPSKFKAPALKKNQNKNKFTFVLNFKNTDKVNRFFKTGLLLSDKTNISGVFDQDSIIKIDAGAPSLNYRNNIFTNLAVNATYSGNILNAAINSSSLSILGRSELKNFHSGLKTKPDNFYFNVNWDNNTKLLDKGSFTANGLFTKNEKNKEAVLNITIDSSDVYSHNNLWKIRKSVIKVDTTAIEIDRLMATNGEHSYLIDGTASENPEDSLKLAFKGIDLSPLNNVARNGQSASQPEFPYNLKGIIDGRIFISNVIKNPLIEADVRVTGFSILGGNYGDLAIQSVWNPDKKVADINASNNYNGKKNIDIKGFYDPGIKKFNISGNATNLPIDALNPLLSFFASGITGTVSGKVNLSGSPDQLYLTGSVLPEKASMKIDYLQTRYTFSDSVRFDKAGIKLRNITVTDEKGNNALLTGSILHNSFKDFRVDLLVNMDKKECLVLNTQQKDNKDFYGTVYATGVTKIKSGPNLLSFDISGKATRGTKFYIPINSDMEVSEHSFVTFVTRDTTKKSSEIKSTAPPKLPSKTAMELNIDLDIAPEAETQLLIDPKAGDVIKGRGTGKLNISLNKKGEFKIYGDYVIEEGDYLFTLQNFLNKRFDVENGGKVIFAGDLLNAEIDITAKYRNLKTSLYPILQDERYNVRIPVEPQIHLTGKLFNPLVGFNIYLPNADEETRTYLKNAITTEEELSRQFLYLLVMNSFYSDSPYKSSNTSTATGTSAMAVTTTEMFTNQLSNWLSQISKDFDIGFNYRPGNKDITSQELQVALSTQLLNDKVTINGNFDVRGANSTVGAPLSGDFDIEYKLTEKIRFKVFNRYNNNLYSGRGTPYTQGIGIFFKQDFNKFSDLLKKKEKSDMKKEDEVKPKE